MKARFYHYYDEVGAPAISVTPSVWDFGNTPVGTPVSKVFTILNVGNGALEITLPITSDHIGYTITADPATSIAPGASTTFTVQFDSAFNASGYAGNISIQSNAASSPTVIAVTARIWAFYASGASNTAEIGTATRVQTDGTIASNGTKFAYSGQASPVWGELSIRSQLITMLDDVAMVGIGVVNESTRSHLTFGWFPTIAINFDARAGIYTDTSTIFALPAATAILPGLAISANTDYPISVVARDTDSDANAEEYQIFAKISGIWKRLWVLKGQNDASMYFGTSDHSAVGTLEKFKVEPLSTAIYNPSVSLLGAVSAGQTWTASSGNFWLRKVLTTRPSALSEIIKFRVQDASNYLVNSINSAGLQTIEKVVAGVATAVGSGGAAVNGSVTEYIADGTNIRGFVGMVQSYSVTITEFTSATGGELNSLGTGGAVSDIEVWERDASGAALASLEGVLNG